MRWLKRCIWLTAWGVWVWLGYGLYRELPRSLGLLVCQIPLEKGQNVVGFVGDTNRLAVQNRSPLQTDEIKLFDAETGSLIDLPNALFRRDMMMDFRESIRRGFLFSSVGFAPGRIDPNSGLRCVDLRTGESRPLTKATIVAATLHDQRPWLAVSEPAIEEDSDIGRVAVIDLESGRELFSRGIPAGRRIERLSFFIPGTDKLVIPTPATFGSESRMDGGVEVWKIGPPPVLEKFVKGATIERSFSVSSTGRIAQKPPDHATRCVVFDLNEERVVFAASETLPGAPGALYISRSGKAVFSADFPDLGVLWDVDSGKVLRRDAEGESTGPDVFGERLLTSEYWSVWWKLWFPNYNYISTAFRDLETGRLIVRLKGFTGNLFPNAAGTLVATTTGKVHRLPYAVNWPFLALCQAVLALPLVMLWFVLRLLRRRRFRRGTDVPRNSAV